MSAFDDWHTNHAKWGGTRMMGRDLARRAWNAALDQLEGPSGIGAIPETTDYALGWNDCRQRMFAAYQARIKELKETT